MNKVKGHLPFQKWSSKWDSAKKAKGEVEAIIDLWKQPVPDCAKRLNWKLELGYRKTHKGLPCGEQKIEKQLLGSKNHFSFRKLVIKGNTSHTFIGVYNDMRCAPDYGSKKTIGQVIADAFGLILDDKGVIRPICVEVKVTDANPWFALVENLKQVKLMRFNEKELNRFLSELHLPNAKGTWGIVLAPETYYTKHKEALAQAKKLLVELKSRTEARIAFCTSDNLPQNEIKVKCSNWNF